MSRRLRRARSGAPTRPGTASTRPGTGSFLPAAALTLLAVTLPAAALMLLTAAVLAPGAAWAANDELGPREGAEVDSGLSLGATILLFVLVPAVILLGTAALVWLPGLVKSDRYRPQKGWRAAPVWFAGPPDPVAAVETADVGQDPRGGASGSW